MNMKKIFILLSLAFLIACSSSTDKKNGNKLNGASSGFNVNAMVTKTILDSVPFGSLPYIDSLAIADNQPLRSIPLSAKNIEFLKLKKLHDFRAYSDEIPDSLFSLVCRLDLSPDYYSLIIHHNNMSESMNYLINYDRDFHVIDYIETSFQQITDCSTRITSKIDSLGITIYNNNILSAPEDNRVFLYTISPDGFFREMPDEQTANGN
jgi:hypothetical protein